MQLSIPTDVEQAVIDELTSVYTIGTSIPDPVPAAFLRVNAAGGVERDLVTDSPVFTLESFAALEGTARDNLAAAIARLDYAAHFLRAVGGKTAYRFSIAGLPQNFPFPSLPTHRRYIATLSLDLRRQSITL